MDNYSSTKAEFIQIRGKLSVSGTYYNIKVDGATKQGSIYYPHASLNAASFNNKFIVVKGYFNGIPSNGKYVNIVAASIELDQSIKTFEVSPTDINVTRDAGSTSFNVSGNVPWTVELQEDNSNMIQSFTPASGEGDGTVTIEYDENTGQAPRTATFVVSTTATGLDKTSYTVVVSQAAPSTGKEVEVTFTAGTDMTSSTAAGHEVLTKDGVVC